MCVDPVIVVFLGVLERVDGSLRDCFVKFFAPACRSLRSAQVKSESTYFSTQCSHWSNLVIISNLASTIEDLTWLQQLV